MITPSIPCFSCISQFLPAVLEEELEAVCREVTDLQRHLGEVEDQREALEDGALAVFRVVEPCLLYTSPSPRDS